VIIGAAILVPPYCLIVWWVFRVSSSKHIGHPLFNAPLKKPENFKVNFSTIYVILMKIMKGVERNAQVTQKPKL
jgi:hypothetical protein